MECELRQYRRQNNFVHREIIRILKNFDMSQPHPLRSSAPPIVKLAEQIEADILKRGLVSGDSYLSAAETAKMLRVGTATANRALQLLEHRQILVRRQRLGTFIANPPGETGHSLRRVNLIVDQNYLKTEGVLADGILVGIQKALPEADLRFRFMPATDDPDFVHNMIDEALQSPHREGFVLVRASLTAQRIVADSGLPAVIHGTPYPSITTIPWIDRDAHQIGQLLTEYLLERGCRHLLLLLRQQVMPGDHGLLDTVQQQLERAGTGRSFTLRCLPAVKGEIQQEVTSLLTRRKGKWGIICRSEPLAHGARSALTSKRSGSLLLSGDIVVTDVYRTQIKELPPYTHTHPILTPEEIGRKIGEQLHRQFAGESLSGDRHVVSVRLVEVNAEKIPTPPNLGRSEILDMGVDSPQNVD